MKADQIDQANDIAQALTDDAVDHYRWLARPEQERNPDGSWPVRECSVCGEEIEPERLDLGKIRCFQCQSAHEAKGRMYATR